MALGWEEGRLLRAASGAIVVLKGLQLVLLKCRYCLCRALGSAFRLKAVRLSEALVWARG